MDYDIFSSPVGKLTISCTENGISGLHIEGDRYFERVPSKWTHNHKSKLLLKAKEQLDEYFAGTLEQFDLPLDLEGTHFQQEVWAALLDVPYGTTTTYAHIAEKIGKPNAVRAVGSAVGRNPVCILIPCHRVLTSDGKLGGFVAGLACKKQLLDLERPNAAAPEELAI